ncbi:hypothetical protein SDRG_08477 [Saprolegnia diclina VS20]|uniref:Peptidase S1 domain-containing protein n=1 Tax=Saprolegnia diclina (strain VS20) TaxID=1156394 RepID=T0Q7D9_SAPDV|nr:hypothetical protein SDRG_08477 [Saprolegnia diclina VS20]EQC33794.1 hypothetical protein SDRG_08477 [Saprolegnia diclina VS20]|eukprot:XP_008612589.1 hypothetical protein SDRG_08477 [Saprolegnia diclina VS20]
MVQIASVFALAALTAVQATPNSANMIQVFGGKEAEIGKHLYVTGRREDETDQNYCGGAVISPTAILTTSYCIEDDNINYVSIGSHYLSGAKDGERIAVKKIVQHPKFNDDTMVYDFVVLELANATTVTPIEILFDENDPAVAPGAVATARGWGTTSVLGPHSDVLKDVDLKIWSNKDCQAAFDNLHNPSLTPADVTMICADGIKGEGTCDDDEGGPLTVSKDGKEMLVGLTSWNAKDSIAPCLTKPAC